jgi:putative transposase
MGWCWLKPTLLPSVGLFSTDLTLTATQIVDYYTLRFQIEFNFRATKQFWGLDDFINVTPTAVTNAVQLSFLMVNLSAILLLPYPLDDPRFSVLDLKAHYRASRYLDEIINSLPVPPPPHLISQVWRKIVSFSAIRPPHSHPHVA